jgi:hypothetical protein
MRKRQGKKRKITSVRAGNGAGGKSNQQPITRSNTKLAAFAGHQSKPGNWAV